MLLLLALRSKRIEGLEVQRVGMFGAGSYLPSALTLRQQDEALSVAESISERGDRPSRSVGLSA